MLRKTILVVFLAATLTACASDGGSDVSPEQAARAECERRQVPADQMAACIEQTEDTIRAARDQQRVPPAQPQNQPR